VSSALLHAFLVLALLALPLGCADRPTVSRLRAASPTVEVPGRLLSAASGDPSAEINPLLTWPPTLEPGREEGTSSALTPRSSTGFSLGLTAGERSDWAASARGSLIHERRLSGGAWFAVGLDGGAERDQATSLGLLVVRAHVGLTGHAPAGGASRLRPLYRVGFAYEWVEVPSVGASFDRYALLAGLGLDAGPPSGWWEVHFEYASLLGESDIEGEVFAGLSLRF
jgi:hypothetical protein